MPDCDPRIREKEQQEEIADAAKVALDTEAEAAARVKKKIANHKKKQQKKCKKQEADAAKVTAAG